MDDVQVISSADVGGIEAAGGTGTANDAAVSVVETVGESKVARLERELREARIEEEANYPQRHVEAAQKAVAKAEAALAGAQLSLRQAHEDNERDAAQKASSATDEAAPAEDDGVSTTEPEA